MHDEAKKKEKRKKRIVLILTIVFLLVIFFIPVIWFLSCLASYTPPEITGVADDGLWFYSKNERSLSDMVTTERLIPSIYHEGVIYTDIYVKDSLYDSDDVYMSLYYTPKDTRKLNYALVKYNIKDKETEFTIHSSDTFSPVYIKKIQDDFLVVCDERTEERPDASYLISKDGIILDYDFQYGNYYLTDEYIFGSKDGIVRYKKWDDEDFTVITTIADSTVSGLYYSNDILVISLQCFWEKPNGMKWLKGKIAYNLKTGESVCIADPAKGETSTLKYEKNGEITAGYFIKSNCKWQSYSNSNGDRKDAVQEYNSELFYIDFKTFETSSVYKFPDTEKGYDFQVYSDYLENAYVSILEETVTATEISYVYYYFDVEKQTVRKGKKTTDDDIKKLKTDVYEDENYEIYIKYQKGSLLGPNYKILHKYNKKTKTDDVMHYTLKGYSFDAVRYY